MERGRGIRSRGSREWEVAGERKGGSRNGRRGQGRELGAAKSWVLLYVHVMSRNEAHALAVLENTGD